MEKQHAQSGNGYNVFASKCPSRKLLNDVTTRWGILVLTTLLNGSARYSQIRDRIDGISDRMLSLTLSTLMQDRLVTKALTTEAGAYELTEAGSTIARQGLEFFDSLYRCLDQLEADGDNPSPR
ncbi:MAG: helix-turn-helix domain-containing protein [Bifidobacterium sp.]|uniref:Helix-turn-helix domain-containing protein n=1 Tax=Bifidobacterium fermentum TaxID=3059035 RepID=A0AB39UPA6_9BIFI